MGKVVGKRNSVCNCKPRRVGDIAECYSDATLAKGRNLAGKLKTESRKCAKIHGIGEKRIQMDIMINR